MSFSFLVARQTTRGGELLVADATLGGGDELRLSGGVKRLFRMHPRNMLEWTEVRL